MRDGLSSINNVRVLDKGSLLSNIVTFHKTGTELNEMGAILKNGKIYYSVSLKQNAV